MSTKEGGLTVSPNSTKPHVGGCGSLKPILFKTEMVQAILEGRKTQTRRIIKLRDGFLPECESISYGIEIDKQGEWQQGKPDKVMDFSKTFPYWQELKPKYKVGDVLWVRETWNNSLNSNEYCYKADTDNPIYLDKKWKWKPSLFMPLDACRLFLKVTNVRIERLQDISNQDAINEGIEPKKIESVTFFKDYGYNNFIHRNPKSSFATLWFEVNGKESWEQNPFVWAIEFERCQIP